MKCNVTVEVLHFVTVTWCNTSVTGVTKCIVTKHKQLKNNDLYL